MAFLEVKDLEVEFQVDKKPVIPLKGISFEMNEGEVLGIVGETGSGKSLTAHAIMDCRRCLGERSGAVSNLPIKVYLKFLKKPCSRFVVRRSPLFPRTP